jgi:hypothetical protein
MNIGNESNTENNLKENLVLELIYKDADESLKTLQANLYNTNTNLALLVGFNATFATLLWKIGSTHVLQVDISKVASSANFYPHGQQLYRNVLYLLNWLLLIKPVVAMLLVSSISIAISTLRPKPTGIIIYPSLMLELSQDRSLEEFRRAVVENRDAVIKEVESKVEAKAKQLRASLSLLGWAAALLAISIAIEA